jgi:hypothetical protein
MCPLCQIMGRVGCLLFLALLPGLCTIAEGKDTSENKSQGPAANCKLGTSLVWAESVADAVKQARQEEKLLFVIHVSGDFRDPEFT